MSTSNLRIISALIISMAFHGMLIVAELGPGRSPVAGLQRKKVSVRLVARRSVPNKSVERPVIERPEKVVRRMPALPEAVEVAVKEIPAFTSPHKVVVPELVEDVSETLSETDDELSEESVEALSSAVILARPLYLENPPPEYPTLARRRHWQGTVMLEVMVSREGRVLELRVNESSGRVVLDEAALKAVSSWRFEPGHRGSRKVDMQVLVPVRFSFK